MGNSFDSVIVLDTGRNGKKLCAGKTKKLTRQKATPFRFVLSSRVERLRRFFRNRRRQQETEEG
jgi:hypothetical protein